VNAAGLTPAGRHELTKPVVKPPVVKSKPVVVDDVDVDVDVEVDVDVDVVGVIGCGVGGGLGVGAGLVVGGLVVGTTGEAVGWGVTQSALGSSN